MHLIALVALVLDDIGALQKQLLASAFLVQFMQNSNLYKYVVIVSWLS